MSLSRKLLCSLGAMLALILSFERRRHVGPERFERGRGTCRKCDGRRANSIWRATSRPATSELTSLERGGALAAMLADRSQAEIYQQRFRTRAERLQKLCRNWLD
jgi:hypothetical protein